MRQVPRPTDKNIHTGWQRWSELKAIFIQSPQHSEILPEFVVQHHYLVLGSVRSHFVLTLSPLNV